jgi:hypothetical protein
MVQHKEEITMSLRNTLRKVYLELGAKGKFDFDDVIAEIRRRCPEEVAQASKMLENTAMKRILNDIAAKKTVPKSSEQYDLFGELQGLPTSLIVGNDRKRTLIEKTSLADIQRSIDLKQLKNSKKKEQANLDAFREKYRDFILSELDSPEEVIARSKGI